MIVMLFNNGETLYDVAQKNGIQLQSLLDYNQLERNDKDVAGNKTVSSTSYYNKSGTCINGNNRQKIIPG